METFQKILYTIFAASCAIHILLIIYHIFNPQLPEVRVYKRDLKDMEFPLSFRLCAYSMVNLNERYKKIGYRNTYDFFRGRSRFNRSLVGWGGHHLNGTYIGSVEEMLERVYFNMSSIVSKIKIYTTKGELVQN